MATFEFEGVDNYIGQLQKLYATADEMAGKAIYNGAGTVYKFVQQGIDGISTDNRHGTSENPVSGPSTYQKEGLRKSLGIAPARYDGSFYNVKIGFDGYNGITTKAWPSGQPNSLIARAVESGTSWMRKQPFMRAAEQAAKGPCEAVMRQTIDKELSKIFE